MTCMHGAPFITMATMKRRKKSDAHSRAMKGQSQSEQGGLLHQRGARLQVQVTGGADGKQVHIHSILSL